MGSTPTFGTSRVAATHLGAWLSLVERSVRVAEVGGSNPLAPTRESGGRGAILCPHSSLDDLVAQLDRASASGAEGCGFEPRRDRH